MGRDVLVGRWTRAAYLFAARACHPDAEAVAGLLKELERLGVKPGWEAEAVLGSCLLLGEGELWGQMLAVSAAARLPLPRVLAGVAQSLALGHNIELIQRLWDEVLVRLIEEPDERARLGQEPEREMLAALTPPRGRDFADLLRAPPYADRPLAGSGLTGKDWSELVERARRELEEVVGAPAPTQEDIEWLEAGYTDPLV
ncbi:hypothetical protein DFJ74DRAFT_658498 [Hyaloraphidium curvatum]|nr:hypothetical protein DFJ74DRAFT_658498 [Hyaloraphidium curvatum]